MPRATLAIDGLWSALCPSFNPGLLLRPALCARPQHVRPFPFANLTCRRNISSEAYDKAVTTQRRNTQRVGTRGEKTALQDADIPHDADKDDQAEERDRGMPALQARMKHLWGSDFSDVQQQHTPALYELLQISATLEKSKEVEYLVDLLVRGRHERPNARIYSALILSNSVPETGSISRVLALLEEMERDGILLDVGICHDVLKVLAVHPDYLVREEIVDYMGRRWFTLTDGGRSHVVAALLKEGQLERAVASLEQMQRDGAKAPDWLLDMAFYSMLEGEEMEAAFDMIKYRQTDKTSAISNNIWYHLLDAASSTRHYSATVFVWDSQVKPGYMNPPTGICSNVLSTAAQIGDTELATDVFRVLGQRATIFTADHYEDLLRTYLTAQPPELRAALSILTLMAGAKLTPTPATVRPLYDHLVFSGHEAAQDATAILRDLHRSARQVPIAPLNAILEYYVEARDFSAALTLYKSMHWFEDASIQRNGTHVPLANIETFNLLFRGARDAGSAALDTALFLASELVDLGLSPNAITYDRLILLCLNAGDLEHAWEYLEEMRALGWSVRPRTARGLVSQLASKQDERCWDLIEGMRDRNPRERAMVKKIALDAWSSRPPGSPRDLDRGESHIQASSRAAKGVDDRLLLRSSLSMY